MTALHWAARHGHQRSVRALINAGASLHIQTTGDGFLGRWAVRCGRRGR
jgi:ankyrin repeat protein